jgi:predicted RNase H-like nuclease
MGAQFIGIDGCRGGWIFAAIEDSRRVEIQFSASIRCIWESFPGAKLMLIDIPIGLPAGTARACDVSARKYLRPRSGACVFPPPCRQALNCDTYEDACAANQRVTGKKISRQTWNILPKIREVDEFLRQAPVCREALRESHPEVCFRALAQKPPRFSKKTAAGRSERMDILRVHLVDGARRLPEAVDRHRKNGAAADDILDALVLAVTARLAAAYPRTLPRHPPRDAAGLPMEIVYAAAEGG